jgi:hypothetical protein
MWRYICYRYHAQCPVSIPTYISRGEGASRLAVVPVIFLLNKKYDTYKAQAVVCVCVCVVWVGVWVCICGLQSVSLYMGTWEHGNGGGGSCTPQGNGRWQGPGERDASTKDTRTACLERLALVRS